MIDGKVVVRAVVALLVAIPAFVLAGHEKHQGLRNALSGFFLALAPMFAWMEFSKWIRAQSQFVPKPTEEIELPPQIQSTAEPQFIGSFQYLRIRMKDIP